jgi:hypothetical protein
MVGPSWRKFQLNSAEVDDLKCHPGISGIFFSYNQPLSCLAHLEKFLEKKELSALERQNGVIEVPRKKTVIRYCYFKYLVHVHHRLNIELDLQSLFGLHVYSCPHWLRPRNPVPP